MPPLDQATADNRLLRTLEPDDFAALADALTPVELGRGIELAAPHDIIDAAYFIRDGLASIVAVGDESQGVETGLLGRDGVVGLPLLLDCDRSPYRTFMQIGGSGHRVEAGALVALIDERPALRKRLLRFVQVLSVQTAFTAVSNALGTIEERLARWLLMSHDRQDGDDIPLTHEFMAVMLGVRRPSVTMALHALEGAGLIKAARGVVSIRDRKALERSAGPTYGVAEAEYERLIGPLR